MKRAKLVVDRETLRDLTLTTVDESNGTSTCRGNCQSRVCSLTCHGCVVRS